MGACPTADVCSLGRTSQRSGQPQQFPETQPESSAIEVACRLQPRGICQPGEKTTMGARHWTRWLLAAATCGVLAAVPVAAQNNAGFDRGYREGISRGAD